MFYRLKQSYMLRGWKHMPWVLVKRPRNKALALSQEQFQMLLLCDGETNVTADQLDEAMQEALQQCEEKGWIETCPKPQPLGQDQYYRYFKNRYVESVYIPTEERATLCVSSQVGCKMNCLFCMTGKQGFSANLTANQILNQIQSLPERDSLTNIVFMGMGEPLDNVDELFKVLEILTAPYGYGWSPKRVTVSTIGVRKGLQRFLEESDCHLAVSLHSPYAEERLSLMPMEKAFPAKEVIELIKRYDFSRQRRVSFEYIVFKGLNDSLRHAAALSRLLREIPCRVNLIRFHAIPDVPLETSDMDQMEVFRDFLNARGIVCTIRASRGEDIFAACGMLSTAKNTTFVSNKNI